MARKKKEAKTETSIKKARKSTKWYNQSLQDWNLCTRKYTKWEDLWYMLGYNNVCSSFI